MTLDSSMFSQAAVDYKTGISALIDNVGKTITLCFADTVTAVGDTFYDQVRDNDQLKPAFKQTSTQPAPIVTKNTETIQALVKWDPKELENFGIRANGQTGYVRLKSYMSTAPDLQRCTHILVQSNLAPFAEVKCRLWKKPVTFGLQTDSFYLSYWEVFT